MPFALYEHRPEEKEYWMETKLNTQFLIGGVTSFIGEYYFVVLSQRTSFRYTCTLPILSQQRD